MIDIAKIVDTRGASHPYTVPQKKLEGGEQGKRTSLDLFLQDGKKTTTFQLRKSSRGQNTTRKGETKIKMPLAGGPTNLELAELLEHVHLEPVSSSSGGAAVQKVT